MLLLYTVSKTVQAPCEKLSPSHYFPQNWPRKCEILENLTICFWLEAGTLSITQYPISRKLERGRLRYRTGIS